MGVTTNFELSVIAKTLPTNDDLAAGAAIFAETWFDREGRDALACSAFFSRFMDLIVADDLRDCMTKTIQNYKARG